MKGSTTITQIKEADYRFYEERGDEVCVNEVEYDRLNWLKHYERLKRTGYTIPEWEVANLEEQLANTYDMTQCIALALRLADLTPSAELFKRACGLAQTSTVENLDSALYEVQEREEFIVVALASVHYELFNSFEFGDYVVSVEMVRRNGKIYRRYVNP